VIIIKLCYERCDVLITYTTFSKIEIYQKILAKIDEIPLEIYQKILAKIDEIPLK